MKKKVILIAGPTAVGKTAAAVRVAKHFQTEIISADSRQCYHELNIGVARPSQEELSSVPHHFVASHSISDAISAAHFETYALDIATALFEKNDVIVLAGGTGLYIKAFMYGLDEIPAIDPDIRAEILFQYAKKGIEWLIKEIKSNDPLYAASQSLQNPQRAMRALEVVKATGSSILSFQKKTLKERSFDVIPLLLDLPREILYERINTRVDLMMEAGLLSEVESLFNFRHLNALQTVGYAELFAYMEGKYKLEEAVDKIKQHTRNFAKRQITWFKHKLKASSCHPDDDVSLMDYLEESV